MPIPRSIPWLLRRGRLTLSHTRFPTGPSLSTDHRSRSVTSTSDVPNRPLAAEPGPLPAARPTGLSTGPGSAALVVVIAAAVAVVAAHRRG
jgi:hypothetical protein